ncbi:MAG: YitT family protein [Duncaniella sp.]|nr:YitT family protein [Duncaniella sp.]MDE5693387.1 YitT family protein [Duncaniella sp.]
MVLLSKKLWMSSRDYVVIVLALIFFGFGFSAFILPEKVVMGGVTGIGTIAYLITGKTYMIGATQYAINLVLLGFAYFIVGKQFVVKTIFGATVVSAVVTIMPPLFDGPLVPGQPFMNVCIGSIITGISLGLVFIHNGSTGGTDIVAAIVAKRTNVTIGRTMLYVDFGIISSSYLFTHDVAKVLYGFVVLIIVSYMVDMVINTNRQAVQFLIISPLWERIATAVNQHARRGVTVMNGMGWYTKHDIKILLIVCRKIESVTIFRIVKSIDQTAFITQANVNGVYGQGFDELKFKQDAKLSEEYKQAERIMESESASDDIAAAPSATQS